MRGYLVRPAKTPGKLPGVLVIHENRGLNPHIEDVARRVALEGFMAFAPDALFPLGGYPGDEDKAREVFPKLDQVKTRRRTPPTSSARSCSTTPRPTSV
jgi:carboxymethylenebutenolidase